MKTLMAITLTLIIMEAKADIIIPGVYDGTTISYPGSPTPVIRCKGNEGTCVRILFGGTKKIAEVCSGNSIQFFINFTDFVVEEIRIADEIIREIKFRN